MYQSRSNSLTLLVVAGAGVALLVVGYFLMLRPSGKTDSSSTVALTAQQSIRSTLVAAGSPPIHISMCRDTKMTEHGMPVYSCGWAFDSPSSAARYPGVTADALAASRLVINIDGKDWTVTCFDYDAKAAGVMPSTLVC